MNEMVYRATFSVKSGYLAHHGILGQKWGDRNFQNEDGSLTPLGRLRYGVGQKRVTVEKAEKDKNKKQTHVMEDKPISEMSTKEIEKMTERMRAEANYAKAQADKVQSDKQAYENALMLSKLNGTYVEPKKKFGETAVGKTLTKVGTYTLEKALTTAADKLITTAFQEEAPTVKQLIGKGLENLSVDQLDIVDKYYKGLANIQADKAKIKTAADEELDKYKKDTEKNKALTDYYNSITTMTEAQMGKSAKQKATDQLNEELNYQKVKNALASEKSKSSSDQRELDKLKMQNSLAEERSKQSKEQQELNRLKTNNAIEDEKKKAADRNKPKDDDYSYEDLITGKGKITTKNAEAVSKTLNAGSSREKTRDAKITAIKSMYQNGKGLSVDEIAKKTGYSVSTVYYLINNS